MTTQILLINDMAEVKVYHLAFCVSCSPTLAMPFGASDEREVWITEHVSATIHYVERKTEIRVTTP